MSSGPIPNAVNLVPSTQMVSNLLNTSSAVVEATNANRIIPTNLLTSAIQIAKPVAQKPGVNNALSVNLLTSALQITKPVAQKPGVNNALSVNLLTSALQIVKPGTQKTVDNNVQSLLNIAMNIAFPKQSMVSGFPDFTGFPGFPDFSSLVVIPEQSKRIGETILTVDETASAYEMDGKMNPEKNKTTKSVVKPIYASSKTKPDAYESTLFDGMPDSLLIDNSKEIGSLVDQVTAINANLKNETELLKK